MDWRDREEIEETASSWGGCSIGLIFILAVIYFIFVPDHDSRYKGHYNSKVVEYARKKYDIPKDVKFDYFPNYVEIREIRKGVFDFNSFYRKFHIVKRPDFRDIEVIGDSIIATLIQSRDEYDEYTDIHTKLLITPKQKEIISNSKNRFMLVIKIYESKLNYDSTGLKSFGKLIDVVKLK